MDNSEETKLCPTCDKDIEVSKFRIHDIQCGRMNYRCHCGMAVSKEDKEHHETEMHVNVSTFELTEIDQVP